MSSCGSRRWGRWSRLTAGIGSPSQLRGAFGTSLIQATDLLTVSIAVLPDLAGDDTFTFGGDVLTVWRAERHAAGVAWRVLCQRQEPNDVPEQSRLMVGPARHVAGRRGRPDPRLRALEQPGEPPPRLVPGPGGPLGRAGWQCRLMRSAACSRSTSTAGSCSPSCSAISATRHCAIARWRSSAICSACCQRKCALASALPCRPCDRSRQMPRTRAALAGQTPGLRNAAVSNARV